MRAKLFYLPALAVTLAALAWAYVEKDDKLNAAAIRAAPQEAREAQTVTNFLSEARADRSMRNSPTVARDENPFSARSWAPRNIAASGPQPASPPGPPQAPPLPFAYKGSVTTGDARFVVLAKSDRDYVVRTGDILDDTYRVERIDAQSLVLQYLPLGIQQTLSLAAPGATASGATASGAPATAASAPRPLVGVPGPVLVHWHPDHDL